MLHQALWTHASSFDARPASVAPARDFVVWHLEAHERSDLVEDLRLIVSELATNAVVHGRVESFTVELQEAAGSVRVAVLDDGVGLFAPRVVGQGLAESGRGLGIVAALSADWGVNIEPTGSTCVWATVAVGDEEAVADEDVH